MTTSSGKKKRSPYGLLLLAILVVTVPIGVIKAIEYQKRASSFAHLHDPLTDRLRSEGRRRALASLEEACSEKLSCKCSKAQIQEALNANLHEMALSLLDESACQDLPEGMRAEALARAGKFQEAKSLAESSIGARPGDPFALYTLAHVAHFSDAPALTLEPIQAAISAGRGAPPYLLSFLLHYNEGAWDQAQKAVEQILELDEDDPEGLYNLALIHHKRDDYPAAREGYLKLLSVAPQHANARYNLGLLTHSVGALDEAKHNLAKLIAIVGTEDDERVKSLRAVIEGPPAPVENRFVLDRGKKPVATQR
jgi:tetratricopeptide (TPR) repeat protein